MSNSPNENRPEDEGINNSAEAGGDQKSMPPSDGTLDAFKDADIGGVPSSDISHEESPGTAGTLDPDMLVAPPASDHAIDPLAVTLNEESAVTGEANSSLGTLPLSDSLQDGELPSGPLNSKTILYDELLMLPSGGPTDQDSTGSSEKLRRVWNAAVGSGGKESGQSLSYERAEASDSVLGRVAVRSVADANAAEAVDADYRIQDKLGVGGMGIVFSAIQTAVNRKVALKTLKAEKSKDTSARKQFFYEAEITADLDHPNVPPIYEFGATGDNICFYTMKLIRGAEWDRILTKKSQEENLEIFNNVADAIAFAHSKNIIHRDIKPDNVIVGAFGEVYVTDWGLAVNLSRTPDKKQIRFGGTPEYMAPEMGQNKGELIDKSCDIYLLGAVLFQVITSKRPRSFKAKASIIERINAVTSNQIDETSVEDPLLEVALMAMNTRPEDRYKTVEDLQGAVREIQRKNTNIKSSIELTKRSESEARLAITSKDYARFNRAIFGFRDAVELWDGNKDAQGELQKVRLAYGQCAYDRGDYDLAIQSLDRKVPEESALLSKSVKAKEAVLQREKRFKTLRNVFGIVTLGALLVISGISFIAYRSSLQTIAAQEKANDEIKKNLDLEKDNREKDRLAVEAKDKQRIAEENAAEDKRLADEKLRKAAEDKRLAEEKAERDRIALEVKAAKDLADATQERLNVERLARLAAERAAAKIQLGQQLTKLGFASAQVDQFNPIGAANLLSQVISEQEEGGEQGEKPDEEAAKLPKPRLQNWAMKRVELLSNYDLHKQELKGTVTALDFAQGKNIGVAGMADGTVRLLRLENGQLIEEKKKEIGSEVKAAAISPAGDEAILAINVAEKNAEPQYQLFRWGLDEGDIEPMRIETTKNREFQGFGYNPDGSAVVAGIRGGLWARIRGGTWDVLAEKVKGDMLDLTWIDNESLLVLSSLDGKHHLYLIQQVLGGATTSGLVALPASINGLNGAQKITAIGLAGPRIMVGTDRGNLSIFDLIVSKDEQETLGATLENGIDLPIRHRRAISQIDSSTAGRIVTGSREPTAHVWRVASNGGVEYETYLTGSPLTDSPSESSEENNIERVVFVDPTRVVDVDSKGVAVAIDIDRQKQRRRLVRISEQTGAPELNSQRIVGIHPRGKTPEAISVDANGVVDLWNLQTGRTRRLQSSQAEGVRFSYFGHTPGAELVDTVVDAEAGVVVTSVRIPKSASSYLVDPIHNREFCVWDQATGEMIRRWSDEGEEPRLTLVASGELLIASDEATKIVDFSGHDIALGELRKTAAAFAAVNSRNPKIVAIFKRAGGGGLGWIWNRETGQWFDDSTNSVEFDKSVPLQALWSRDGERLYVLDVGGNVTQLVLENGVLSLSNSGEKSGVAKLDLTTNLQNALRDYQNIDLAIEDGGGFDRLHINIRDAKSQIPQTSLSTLEFAKDGLQTPTIANSSSSEGLSWLNDSVRVNVKPAISVLAKRRVGEKLFVSMRSGNVYGVSAASGTSTVFGRQPFVASTSDADGTFLLTLHEDGSILKLDLADPNQATWSRLSFLGPKTDPDRIEFSPRIELSPSGLELAIYDPAKQSLRIVDSQNGTDLRAYDAVVEFGWDPKHPSTIVFVEGTGRMVLEQAGVPQEIAKLPLDGNTIKGVHFFEEKWQDANRAVTPYVLVQVQGADAQARDADAQAKADGKLWFIPRDPGEGVVKMEPKFKKISRDLKLAVSPTDSILASGDSTGTIRIWFASPEYDILSEIYDLPGEGDSPIRRIAFSGDGDTLMTSDDQNRLFGWMSRDHLSDPSK